MNVQGSNVLKWTEEDGHNRSIVFFCTSVFEGIKAIIKVIWVYLESFWGQILFQTPPRLIVESLGLSSNFSISFLIWIGTVVPALQGCWDVLGNCCSLFLVNLMLVFQEWMHLNL